MIFQRSLFALAVTVSAASSFAMTPIGQLQSEGRFQVISAGNDEPVRINQSEYTFFSGDTVIATRGDAVLNLNGGGGLGFPKDSRVTVVQTDAGGFEAEIVDGSVLYAFPEGRENFVFRVGNFTVHGQVPETRALRVSSEATLADMNGGTSVGTIERLADGNIKATVRSGALHIRNGDMLRYQVSAGETVGLLDLPQQVRTQKSPPAGGSPPVLMQTPERVSTNEEFLMRWEASDPVDGDYVVIAESGAEPDEFESLVSSNEGNELSLKAPEKAGDYEIRFIDGQTGQIKRFVYLDVVQEAAVAGGILSSGPAVGGLLGVTAGATGVFIASEIDDDDNERERSVSP